MLFCEILTINSRSLFGITELNAFSIHAMNHINKSILLLFFHFIANSIRVPSAMNVTLLCRHT